MILGAIKKSIKRLQYGRLRFVPAIVASVQQTIVNRSPVIVYVDGDGHWHSDRKGVKLVSPFLLLTAWSMPSVLDLWCHKYLCKKGDVVIDVGAGIGDDAVVFSRLVGKSGRVIAVEAHPVTYRCLLKTVKENHLDNVTCVNVALGDMEAVVSFSDDQSFMGNNLVVNGGAIKVGMTTLRKLLSNVGLSGANYLKMNIEGAEARALSGMSEVLKFIPNIVVSCHDFRAINGEADSFRTLECVSGILSDAGYTLSRRLDDKREEVPFYVYGALDNHAARTEPAVPER